MNFYEKALIIDSVSISRWTQRQNTQQKVIPTHYEVIHAYEFLRAKHLFIPLSWVILPEWA